MRIIFICHGNICRSPMAEYLFKDILKKNDIDGVEVVSRATSGEEEGNPCHYGTRDILKKLGIDVSAHASTVLTRKECDEADLLICMDKYNVWHVQNICGEENERKIKRLLEFGNVGGDIEDPWYTHNFKKCYKDVSAGLKELLYYVKENK